ncbi:hypothetical protein, partial [Escherichia coli]|uniref:hypothetical protein n=1 Tax=Escherichia coli TaxID=562 RepID=UPI000CAA318B
RQPGGVFPTVETAQKVLDIARAHENGVVTYKAIWSAFRPDEPWKANASLRQVTNALSRVGFYCIRHGLPQIQTLVVNGTKGEL